MTPANEMELKFDSRSANEGFARVAVAAFMTQLNPTVVRLPPLPEMIAVWSMR